jgi:glycosyltransferase involved in cell wall biosynthesis
MIYYFCPYGISAEIAERRQLVISQAAVNRIDEIVNTISEKNDVTIVSTALTRTKTAVGEYLQQLNARCKVYLPKLSCGKDQNIKMLKDIIKYVKKNIKDGDIIMIYNAHYFMLPILCAFAHKKNIKFVYQIEEFYSTSDYYGSLKKNLMILSEMLFSAGCDAYIAVSKTLNNKYLNGKPHIISYGYVDPITETANKSGNDDSRLNLVYAGRLDVDGGIDILLNVIPKITCECDLVITGSGPLKEKILTYSNTNPKVNMDYRGFVSEEELNEILQRADACLSMLRTDKAFSQKSFPSKVIKYLSYGNMVISSNVPALSDLRDLFPNLLIYNDEEEFVQRIKEASFMARKMNKAEQKNNFDTFYNKKRNELSDFFDALSV